MTTDERFDDLLNKTGMVSLYQKKDGYNQYHSVSFPICEPEALRRFNENVSRADFLWLIGEMKNRGLVKRA
jgi:hypothetical protein